MAEWVELEQHHRLVRAGEQLSHVYFPANCIVSLLSPLDASRNYEASQIGFEGMLGASSGLGVLASPFDAVVSGAGQAWRIRLDVWRRQCLSSSPLTQLSTRYLFVELSQLGTMVGCAHCHSLTQRLARFLLSSQIRLRTPDIQMTHAALAHLLGVRRAGVSLAAARLQERGIIRYARGHILVLDGAALQEESCACFAQNIGIYEQVMSEPQTAADRFAPFSKPHESYR